MGDFDCHHKRRIITVLRSQYSICRECYRGTEIAEITPQFEHYIEDGLKKVRVRCRHCPRISLVDRFRPHLPIHNPRSSTTDQEPTVTISDDEDGQGSL